MAKISEEEFNEILSELENDLAPFKEDEYKEFLLEANKISPHGEQTKDDPYFALALALNCAIWSDEAAFKQQSKVKVFTTGELFKLLEKPDSGTASDGMDSGSK